MNSAHNTYKITVNAGTNNVRQFEVPASRWREFVDSAERQAKAADLMIAITVESARRGVIYDSIAL